MEKEKGRSFCQNGEWQQKAGVERERAATERYKERRKFKEKKAKIERARSEGRYSICIYHLT